MFSKVEVIGEYQEFIYCACGCHKTRSKYNYRNRECYFINHHHNKGLKFSEEHKKKLSQSRKGKSIAEETRKKISNSMKGEKKSFLWQTS